MRKSVQTDICPDAGFVRSGYITLTITAGTFRYAGINGSWWSLYGDTATGAYNLVFNNTIVNPSRNEMRFVKGVFSLEIQLFFQIILQR